MPKLAKKTSSTSNKSDPGKKKPSAISKAPKGKQSAKPATNKKAAVQPKRSGSTKESKANDVFMDMFVFEHCIVFILSLDMSRFLRITSFSCFDVSHQNETLI